MSEEGALLRRALATIDRLQARLEHLEAARREPIAIIGLGCRFPGAEDPEAFWQLLEQGSEAVDEVPPDRWDAAALFDPDPTREGRITTTRIGALGPPELFDAAFFGIAPREAVSLDPQQRLLLEVAWEALEDAAVAPDQLAGSATGVFAAAFGTDQFELLARGGRAGMDPYFASGTVHSMASGRIAYVLGLNGPAITVDTACSSSLVAVHLAARALRSGDCDLALAGGVSRILLPTYSLTFSRARVVAPDGRCKAFDAVADGYVRAEGCGVLVLKRLSRAQADGDRILAVIRGSAVNQDGASSGLTVPNGPAQEAVIRAALADAGLGPERVGYIEAHGTGTALGDPIEMGALGAVFADGRSAARPLWVGSVKTNIGHAEAAAGVAGLIKAVLALRTGRIPPHLHFHTPSPQIDWRGGALAVPSAARPFPAVAGERRVAGVSSFGLSGTNAHVVVEAAEPAAAGGAAAEDGRARLLVLSARSEAALAALATRWAARLERGELAFADVCHTAAVGRAALPWRLALVASSSAEAAGLLRAGGPALARGRAGRGKLAFLFTGQGAHRPGAGRELYEAGGAFRATIDRCDALLRDDLEHSVPDLLWGMAADQVDVAAQPVLFSLQMALAAQWQEWGVTPDVVLGHSFGEFAAACVAGVFDLETGLRLVAARGRLMGAAPTGGGMIAVALPAARAMELAKRCPEVLLAADNGPATTLTGPSASLAAAAEAILAAEPDAKIDWLPFDTAFHSPAVAEIGERFTAVIAQASLLPPRLPMVSTVLGSPVSADLVRPSYWGEQIWRPVLFAGAAACLPAAGVRTAIELGPTAVLAKLGRACFPSEITWLSSLRSGYSARSTMLEALGGLWTRGGGFDPPAANGAGLRIALPTYPWQRQRFWVDESVSAGARAAAAPATGDSRVREVGAFYSGLVDIFTELNAHARAHPDEDLFLTLAPFPDIIPGFSWIQTNRFPERQREHLRLFLDAQREMRALLFRHVDFATCRHVLDLGCGHGADLVALARRHPQLRLVGQTIAAGQAEVAREKICRLGLGDRIDVRICDSTTATSDERFDLALGFEVIHHIPDKKRLFATLADRLNDGALLVAADFIAGEDVTIDDAATLSSFLDRSGWSEVLAINGFEVVDGVDISLPVANFLHDPDLETHLESLRRPGNGLAGVDPAVRAAFKGFVRLGELLRQGLATYLLLSARRNPAASRAELLAKNHDRLGHLLVYDLVAPARWLYEVAWRETTPKAHIVSSASMAKPVPNPIQAPSGGHLLLAAGCVSGGVAGRLAGADWGEVVSEAGLAARVAAGGGLGVVDLRALDAGPDGESPAAAAERLALGVVRLGQAVGGRLPVRLVTCGAVATCAGEPVPAPSQAGLWGLAAAAALEEPASGWRRVDLDPAAADEAGLAAALGLELARADGEDRVAWRGGARRLARLVRRCAARGAAGGFATRGSWLVTGGLGGLGRALGPWLRARGAERVVLAGRRSGEPPSGCEACCLDVTDAAAVEGLLRALAESGPPLVGIVHAAGVLADMPLARLDRPRLTRVLGPKVFGAWHLHVASRRLAPGLERFVLFGSVAGVLGNAGQASHAAANAFLDGLAWHRRAQRLPATAIDWGAWGQIGAAAAAADRLDLRWTMLMPPEAALATLDGLLAADAPQTMVVPVDWSAFHAMATTPHDAFTGELLSDGQPRKGRSRDVIGWDGSPGKLGENSGSIEHVLSEELRRILGPGSEAIEHDRSLHDYGFDSLMAITLRNRIRASFGVEPDLAFLIAGTTVACLADHIRALQGNSKIALPTEEADVARMVAGLNEAEVDRLLGQLLADRTLTERATSVPALATPSSSSVDDRP